MVDHLTGVLGGGVHGGAAGGQLTGHALAHGTVDDTGHILRDDRAEYFLAAGLVQNLAAAGFRRARQAAITQEITEIVAGAEI